MWKTKNQKREDKREELNHSVEIIGMFKQNCSKTKLKMSGTTGQDLHFELSTLGEKITTAQAQGIFSKES